MKIKANTSTLKQTRWYEYAVRFLMGGAITAIAGLIAKKFGPTVGGLFLAFPAIFPATATLVEKHERQKKEKHGLQGQCRGRLAAALDAAGATMGSIALIIFAVLVWKFLPGHRTWLALLTGTILWLGVALIIWRIREEL